MITLNSDKENELDYDNKIYNPMNHLEKINFPRGASTPGEEKIGEYISTTLKSYGYEPELQEFPFITRKYTLMSIMPFMIFGIWALFLISNIILFSYNIYLSLIILFFPFFFIFLIINFGKLNENLVKKNRRKLNKMEQDIKENKLDKKILRNLKYSRNIVTSFGLETAEKHILFTAHIDSISSKMSLKFMKFFALIGIGGFLFINLAYFINLIIDQVISRNIIQDFSFFFILITILISSSAYLLFLSRFFRGNESHGVIDDGTGVAILLEIAKFLKETDLKDVYITLGFFGCEELGLFGSSHFFRNYGHRFSKDKTHVISVDMIGEKGPVTYVRALFPIKKKLLYQDFNDKIEAVAHNLGIEVKGTNFMYSGSDFAHWFFDGYKTNWFISGSSLIHSKNDNLANIDSNLVNDTLKLILEYLRTNFESK